MAASDDIRCGRVRGSMKTNALLQKIEVARVKKSTFQNPPDEKIFGISRTPDAEGAREVSMIWKEHQAKADDVPGPDFKAMNKLAASAGLTKAKDQTIFRSGHAVSLKQGHHAHRHLHLPSDNDTEFAYGRPSTYKSLEEIRVAGKDNPNMKHLIQGAYTWEWIKMNRERAAEFDTSAHYIPPRGTKATLGHTIGAAKHFAAPAEKEPFKLTKFKHATTRIDNKAPASLKTVRA